jgi:hypothetical protein
MSNSTEAVFHDPVSPSQRYQEELARGVKPSIDYAGECRGATWKAERDNEAMVSKELDKGEKKGSEDAALRSSKDKDYRPTT